LRSDTFVGVAPITANLDDATYSSRAFNDAVRQLMSQAGVKIESFTLIEDGKVLFDQIQSKSNIVVHEYQIEEESRDDKVYRVKVSFLYSEGTQNALHLVV
jgi:NAD(P)H-dependent flavin oxidoreductase YrpB (nitropropane dioxygenase family)